MKTILEELYDGKIYSDELIIPKDPGYNTLNQKKNQAQWKLRHHLYMGLSWVH